MEDTFTLSSGSRVMGFCVCFSTPSEFPHVSIRLGHHSSGQRGTRATLRAGRVQRLAYIGDYGANLNSAVDASTGSMVEKFAHVGLRGTWTRCNSLSAHDT